MWYSFKLLYFESTVDYSSFPMFLIHELCSWNSKTESLVSNLVYLAVILNGFHVYKLKRKINMLPYRFEQYNTATSSLTICSCCSSYGLKQYTMDTFDNALNLLSVNTFSYALNRSGWCKYGWDDDANVNRMMQKWSDRLVRKVIIV